jgi:hypothetical protein
LNTDTGVAVTVARPNIAEDLAEREPSPKLALQMASGGILPFLKEAY